MLKDKDEDVRRAAIEALEKIFPQIDESEISEILNVLAELASKGDENALRLLIEIDERFYCPYAVLS